MVIQAVPGMKERHLLTHWMTTRRTSVEEAPKTRRRMVEQDSKNSRSAVEERPSFIVKPQKNEQLWQSQITFY